MKFYNMLLIFMLMMFTSSFATEVKIKESVLVIVSDRSASSMTAGAHKYMKEFSNASIKIRTVKQITELNSTKLNSLIKNSTTILMVSVFGDQVERLLNQEYLSVENIYVFQGDRRLLKLNKHSNIHPFVNISLSTLKAISKHQPENQSAIEFLKEQQGKYPIYKEWFNVRAYWVNRSLENTSSLFHYLFDKSTAPDVKSVDSIRFIKHTRKSSQVISKDMIHLHLSNKKPIVWIVDHNTGDRVGDWDLHEKISDDSEWQYISVLASWGTPTKQAIDIIKNTMSHKSLNKTPWSVISLQDFVLGGGEGRKSVSDTLSKMNVAVFKGIRLTEWTDAQWQLSVEGLPTDSTHYRIAMPELQGIGQAQILSFSSQENEDIKTGVKLTHSVPHLEEIQRLKRRVSRQFALQTKQNKDKKIAIIYYNHPPGRHNIGADNLNVVDSLMEILYSLKSKGYDTGTLPEDSKALLNILQERGLNLSDDKKALKEMSSLVPTMSVDKYKEWYISLPKVIQSEMINGPLGALHQLLEEEIKRLSTISNIKERQKYIQVLKDRVYSKLDDIEHALDGTRHKARERALDLISQLRTFYVNILSSTWKIEKVDWDEASNVSKALISMNIEGLRGWGEAPGDVMVWDNKFLIPGVKFGNIYIGPQPPRGWELHEELLHANMSFPPTHQYLAFYHYIKDIFSADALIHLGRHSTYEFLPTRSVGLNYNDYPSIVVGELPSIYPYIVDGVGEGIQAKRRGLAVMVDHLTPPLAITDLYDNLLKLRQLIESAETTDNKEAKNKAVKELRKQIKVLNLRDELISSMDEELRVRGVSFDEVDDNLLLHEVGHYLTKMQERFMPLGLHVFGKEWAEKAVDTMLKSMSDGNDDEFKYRENLLKSPKAEMSSLLNALSGGFVAPGKGNDPIRTPESLPTGRNFYALNGSLLPTAIGYDVGYKLAKKVRDKDDTELNDKQAIILWASDAVRDEGAMIAFGMDLLGVKPIWNSRGTIKGLELLPLSNDRKKRLDVVFTTSGLFRDLYAEHLLLLDKAALLALDASRDYIFKNYPALSLALKEALKPLGEWQNGGYETPDVNQIAANWIKEASDTLKSNPNISSKELGRKTTIRVFGTAPGAYGAGINRLVERSGSWKDRSELANAYIKRMGHAYGVGLSGSSSQDLFKQQLSSVKNTYLGRASNLYGLMDNNDAFDYLGGLNLAVESVSGSVPNSSVINHSNSNNLRMEYLPSALLSELRGRFLNPQWLKPLMKEGYAGARTMGSEFMEYLWGWQVTSPDIIDDWVWQEVKSVYIDDSHNIGIDKFLSNEHNRYIQTNMLAIMLVSIDKGFWKADEKTIKQLSNHFTKNIIEHGIPGSGHTHSNHHLYDFVKQHISKEKSQELENVLKESRIELKQAEDTPSHIREISLKNNENIIESNKSDTKEKDFSYDYKMLIISIIVISILLGYIRGIKRR